MLEQGNVQDAEFSRTRGEHDGWIEIVTDRAAILARNINVYTLIPICSIIFRCV